MATYQFERQRVASFQLDAFKTGGTKTTYRGVDGTQTDADIIVGGVQQLLGVVQWQERYDPLDAKRTIEERVTNAS